ncbi:hypothetical protein J4219_04210 [Candidatus Woesearchaeota archaeon]|nr:hypothetical protein [Candidatus Woesearchaeota archaeon]
MALFSFNPDGSLRLPDKFQKEKDAAAREFVSMRVVRIARRAVSDTPLIDELDVEFSQKIENPGIFESLFKGAVDRIRNEAQITCEKTSDRSWTVRIISGKYRESWINEFRHFLSDSLQVKVQFSGQANAFRKGNSYSFAD